MNAAPPLAAASVIVAGDDPLARNQLSDLLLAAGYLVTAVVSRAQLDAALTAHEAGLAVVVAGPPDPSPPLPRDRLSPRELEVLELASQGLPDKLIATTLGIAVRTVRFHLEGAMRKLEAHNRTEAVAKAGVGGRFL